MKMQENLCLQCKKLSVGASNRLVQDSCGHKKCRVCLLEDEEKCRQCENENAAKNGVGEEQFAVNQTNCAVVNNHTAVIQLNGNVTKTSDKEDKTQKLEDNKIFFLEDSENTFQETKVESTKVVKKKILLTKVKKPDKNKRSYSSIDIPKHIKVILDPLSYNCDICNKSFYTKAHVKYHTYCAGVVKPYKCDICQKEFILRSQLDVHSYKHKENKTYVCTTCNKAFGDRRKLARHKALHLNTNTYMCPKCSNTYRSKESLRIHLIIHKGEKPYACKLCTSRFSNISNLNKHVISHSKEKAYMCDQCGKRFKLKWALTVHRKSHLRIRPHQCNICQKTFVNNKDLQRHSLIHADTKAYTCSICGTGFRRKDNLRRHMKNTHPGKKGEAIKNVAPPPAKKPPIPVDNPNAINVITASPAFTKGKADLAAPAPVPSDCRIGGTTVINGPIKLAFKTPAFKSNYNINRDFNYVPPPQLQKTYDMAESVDICQKILSPHTTTLPRSIIHKAEPTSQEIFQKILSPYSTPPIHYETSFQNRKHAMIKNIKFKVPIQYTNNFKENTQNESATLESIGIGTVESSTDSNVNIYTELKPVALTSVIVNNNSSPPSNMHWRRRTSQNLNLKN